MSNLQDFVLDTTDDTDMSMYIQSNVLEPITITDDIAKFVLPNEGILSRDSYFQFELTAGKTGGMLPIGSGIFSLIKRAELRVGSQRISVQDNMAIFRSITKSYDTASYRNSYTRYLNGVNTVISPTAVGADGVTSSNAAFGFLQPTGSLPDPLDAGNVLLPYEMELSTDAALTPSWSVKLGDLFPVLSDGGLELPLFLIKDPVEILLTFNKQTVGTETSSPNSYGSLAVFTGADGARASATSTAALVKDTCLLFSDHLYYTDTRMFQIEESMNASKGMALLYTDLISVNNFQPKLTVAEGGTPAAGTTTPKKLNFQIPVSNYSLKNIFTCWNCIDYTGLNATAVNPTTGLTDVNLPQIIGAFSNSLYGKYGLVNSPRPYDIQIRVNDELHFPQDLISNALKFNECEYVYGSPVNLACGLYSFNGSNSGVASDGYQFKANLCGFFPDNPVDYNFWGGIQLDRNLTAFQHFLGINLSTVYGDSNQDSILVNQKPMELLVNWYYNNDMNCDLHNITFCEVVKMFSMKDGQVVIQDHVTQLQRQ